MNQEDRVFACCFSLLSFFDAAAATFPLHGGYYYVLGDIHPPKKKGMGTRE